MRIYTKIRWNAIINSLLVGTVVVFVLTIVSALQTYSFSHLWGRRHLIRQIGSKFFQSELSFPEDLMPAKHSARQTTNENGRNIMIRRPKRYDLDPKPTNNVKFISEKHTQGVLASRPPQCILLGFGKCGTSALLEFLDLHPNIVTLDWEPDYFCDRMYPKYDLQWYVKRMPPSFPDQITIEKSPCYIVEHDSHLRMHAMNSSLKLMVLVRDPVIRVISEYGHYSATESYWGRIPTPLIDRITSKETGKLQESQLLKTGNYLPHFEHLLKIFPRQQLLVLDGDQLILDPISQLSKVEDFLHLPHHISDRYIYFDTDKGFYCMTNPGTGEKKCLGKSKGRQHEKLDDNVKKRLADFYRPYNEKLFELLQQRFDWPK